MTAVIFCAHFLHGRRVASKQADRQTDTLRQTDRHAQTDRCFQMLSGQLCEYVQEHVVCVCE